MFFRKVDSFIEKWITDYKIREENNINKCLLIKGLRQIGKSYSIKRAIGLNPEDELSIIGNIEIDNRVFTSIEINLTKNDSFIFTSSIIMGYLF